MPKIKKEELERVYNSLHKPKEVVLPANRKTPRKVDYVYDIRPNKKVIYFIDGYNLMYSYSETKNVAASDLISARDKIIDLVCDFQGYAGQECVLVFDAYRNDISIPMISKQYNITIVYTKKDQTADTYIEQKTSELSDEYRIFVVTSDGLEQLKVFSNNALRMSTNQFIKRYESYKRNTKNKTKNQRNQPLKELRKLLFED